MRYIAAVALALLSAPALVQSVVTRCVSPSGHAWYSQQPLVPAKSAGWQADKISDGTYFLLRKDDGGFDIIFTDATKRTISSRDDGAQMVTLRDGGGTVVVLVNYPDMSVETWHFRLNEAGRGDVTVSQARYGERVMVTKHSLMRAECAR